MNDQIKLTEQEERVVGFLLSNNNGSVNWEELAQFAKSPQSVKLKTIKKTISEIRRKYVSGGLPVPFNVKFSTISTEEDKEPETAPVPQNLVQIKRTLLGNTMIVNSNNPALPAQIDFALDANRRSVKTQYGSHLLNEHEWNVFKYLHANAGKLIPISDLRDRVMFENYGSKLPARWFDSIMRVINNMRRQVPGLERRLLTVKGAETTYLFQ